MNRENMVATISPIFGKRTDSLFPITFYWSEIAHHFVIYSRLLHSQVPLPIVFSLKLQEKLFFFLSCCILDIFLLLAISLKWLSFKLTKSAYVTSSPQTH